MPAVAVRTVDLGKIQIARLCFTEGIPMLEIADPPGTDGQPMQWLVISGRESLTVLAHSIADFLMDYPDRTEEEELKIP